MPTKATPSLLTVHAVSSFSHTTSNMFSKDFSPNYEVGPRRGASTATCKRRRLAKTAAAGPYEDEDEEEYGDVYPLWNIVPGANPRTPRRANMKHFASAFV